MKIERFICIKKLEKTIEGKTIVAFPGSIWSMSQRAYWNGENVLTNEKRPEWQIVVSDYLLNLCFKPTIRELK